MKWIQEMLARRKKAASLSTAVKRSFFASVAFHGALLLIATVFVISHIFYNRESTFTGQPPPSKSYEPRKVELKVKVSRQQRSSSRPSMAPRLVAAKESTHLALPEIKLDSKLVTTTFQPKFKAVTGRGLGAGLGTGYGTSGFGEGVSAVNFFGVQAKGERIAILVDVSVSMIESGEKAGKGFADYLRVKDRVGSVIDSLKDGTLFNVVTFADACSTLSTNMVFASNETRKEAKKFLQPYNTDRNNNGLESGNFSGGGGLQAMGGTTRMDLALAAAMRDGADTILIITDGLPAVKKAVDLEAMQAYQNTLSQWQKANVGAVAAAQPAQAAGPPRQVWVPATPARPPAAASLKEGSHPDPGAPAQPGHWITVQDHPGGGPAAPQPPPAPQPGNWKLADFIKHISLLYDEIYKPKGLKPPVICCIGYFGHGEQVDKEDKDDIKEGDIFLRQLASQYKGQYRLVRSMR